MNAKLYFGIILLLLFCAYHNAVSQCIENPCWAWEKTLSSTDGIYGNAITLDPTWNGDIYVAGGFEGTVDFDPGPEIVSGSTQSTSVGIFLVKFDASGNFLWVRTMTGISGGGAFATSLVIDPTGDGAIFITGNIYDKVDFDPGPGIYQLESVEDWDIFISKFDMDGQFIWAKTVGGTQADFGNSISIDPRGNGEIYTVGLFKGVADFDPGAGTFHLVSKGQDDIFILKLSTEGNFIWASQIGGPDGEYCRSLEIDPSAEGSIYTTGYFEGESDFISIGDTIHLIGATNRNNFISKMDSSGKFQWVKQFGNIGPSGGDHSGKLALSFSGSGNIYITGSFQGKADFDPGPDTLWLNSVNASSDIFISKLSHEGELIWAKSMGGNSLDFGTSLIIQPGERENIYINGNFYGQSDFDPGPEKKEIPSTGIKDIFICSLDSSGNYRWVKTIKGPGEEWVNLNAIDNKYLYQTGFFNGTSISFDGNSIPNSGPPSSGADLYVAKLDILTSIGDQTNKTLPISFYPNPVISEFNIVMDVDEFRDVDIKLFNALGEVVYFSHVENIGQNITIDISTLPTGIYFVELNMGGNRVIEKVLKE